MLNLSCCGGDLGFLIDTKKIKVCKGPFNNYSCADEVESNF
jgi:hypothetical protein